MITPPNDTTADPHVVLAALRAERDAALAREVALAKALAERSAELARYNNEYGKQIEHQSATIDVLKTMSKSPGNPQPVFELITRHASERCDASAVLWEFDGTLMHCRASHGADHNMAAQEAIIRQFPAPPHRGVISARAILEQRLIHIPNATEDAEIWPPPIANGARSYAAIPLMRDHKAIGAIGMNSPVAGGFSESQIALLRTFAELAVIAISSAETYRELRKRNVDLRESLEYQTATSEVLKLISRSSFDLQPVFQTVADTAVRLCHADQAGIYLDENGEYRWVSGYSQLPDYERIEREARIRPGTGTLVGRVALEGRPIQILDAWTDTGYEAKEDARVGGIHTLLGIPLLRDGSPIGVIGLGRQKIEPFTERQIELVSTFAAQAVIAIENARLITEQREALERQIATAEVLQVINASPGNLAPVFDTVLESALRLCAASFGTLLTYDGESIERVALLGVPPAFAEWSHRNPLTKQAALISRGIETGKPIQAADVVTDAFLATSPGVRDPLVELGGVRALLQVPLLKDGAVAGFIVVFRREPGAFPVKQIGLLENFAAQSVIAMENARLLGELQQRTAALAARNSEYGERIEQQSATIDVLKAMSDSPGDTQPVFDLIARRAAELCESRSGLWEFDGTLMHVRAHHGVDSETVAAFLRRFPRQPDHGTAAGRAILERRLVHVKDVAADPGMSRVTRDLGGNAIAAIPLLRDGQPMGAIALNGSPPGGFSDSQIALLQTFAEQAVIAIGSVNTYRELRARTAELTRSVTELQALEEVLRAVNSSLDLDTVLATIISRAVQLSEADEGTIYEFDQTEEVFVPKAAVGMTAERVEWLRERKVRLGETHLGRSAVLRAPVQIDDVQQDPATADAGGLLRGIHAVLAVPLLREDSVVGGLVIRRRSGGGFAPTIPTLLQTFAGQSVLAIENARLFQEARRARAAAEITLADLRRAQDRLIQAEKMASLGQLTAGIAHEIKNPLNFVNNFADLSVDLLDELNAAVAPDKLAAAADQRAEIDDLTATLKGNLEKIVQHGTRADSIIKNMLLHSRSGPSEHRAIQLNATVEEALNLAYHGARAETPGFNITMKKDLDPAAGMVDLYPQEFVRVMLNLINNGFYAARKPANQGAEAGFEPTLWLTTRNLGEQVEIRVRDNGTGISEAVRAKIFEPFFTTKPAGEGTGLGLSLSYDIVVKQHGGRLTVDSRIDAFTEFEIILPRGMAATDGGQA